MNQTQNYQLNQWEMTDLIKMEDFNGDNSKVDAALKTLAGQVAGKASSSTVSSLSTKVNTKAAQSDLTAAVNRVTALESGKADKTALTAEQTARENADNAEKAAREAADTALRSENCWVKLGEWTMTADAMAFSIPVENAGAYRELRLFYQNYMKYSGTIGLRLNGSDSPYYCFVESSQTNSTSAETSITLNPRGGGHSGGFVSLFPIGNGWVGYSCEGIARDSYIWGIHGTGMYLNMDLSELTTLDIFSTQNDLISGTSFALYGLKK